MKYLQSVLSLAFFGLILWTGQACADSVNNLELSVNSLSSCPGDSFCFGWDPSATAIEFVLPNGGGTYQFLAANDGGSANRYLQITSLKLIISATGLDITCASTIFANCSVTNPHPKTTVVFFSGGKIYAGQYFSLDFDCASGTCSWPGGMSVMAMSGTNVPEPASMALIVTGVGAILTLRLRKFRQL